jgi:hypothetical protein
LFRPPGLLFSKLVRAVPDSGAPNRNRSNKDYIMNAQRTRVPGKVAADTERARAELANGLAGEHVDERRQRSAIHSYAQDALGGLTGPFAVGKLDEDQTFVLHAHGVDVYSLQHIEDLQLSVERRPLPPLLGGTYRELIDFYPDPHVLGAGLRRVTVTYTHELLGDEPIEVRQDESTAELRETEEAVFALLRGWSRERDPGAISKD